MYMPACLHIYMIIFDIVLNCITIYLHSITFYYITCSSVYYIVYTHTIHAYIYVYIYILMTHIDYKYKHFVCFFSVMYYILLSTYKYIM